MAANSFFEMSFPFVLKKGDVDSGLAGSDHVIEGEMRVGGQVTRPLDRPLRIWFCYSHFLSFFDAIPLSL